MALIGGPYEDSGGNETYPRRSRTATPYFEGAQTPPPVQSASAPPVPGGTAGPNQPAPPPSAPPADPTPAPPSQNFNWLSGFDTTKLADPTHTSAKYQMGRIFSQYDPRGGVTDPMLQALNALGYASFYGSRDRLGFRNVTSAGRAAGLDPHDFEGDFIKNYTGVDPNDHSGALWQYDWWEQPSQLGALGAAVGTPQGFSFPPQQSGLEALLPLLTTIVNKPTPAAAPGLDPATLSAILASVQPPQAPVSASPVQTQSPPMMPSAGGGGSASITPMLAAGGGTTPIEDPFTAWLRSMLGQQGVGR